MTSQNLSSKDFRRQLEGYGLTTANILYLEFVKMVARSRPPIGATRRLPNGGLLLSPRRKRYQAQIGLI